MPGLHFDDTCVTDDDCSEFPNTGIEINDAIDHWYNDDDPSLRCWTSECWPGFRNQTSHIWQMEGRRHSPQVLLVQTRSSQDPPVCRMLWSHQVTNHSSAWCHVMMYWPIRKVVTLQDGCFADYHCNDLPNTECSEDLLMPRYNKSCQCIPGNKPFLPDPRTGLVEGCAPLTDQVNYLFEPSGLSIFLWRTWPLSKDVPGNLTSRTRQSGCQKHISQLIKKYHHSL